MEVSDTFLTMCSLERKPDMLRITLAEQNIQKRIQGKKLTIMIANILAAWSKKVSGPCCLEVPGSVISRKLVECMPKLTQADGDALKLNAIVSKNYSMLVEL